MAFPHPMPLLCRIWRNPHPALPPTTPPDVDNVPCYLQQFRTEWDNLAASSTQPPGRFLYCPKGTDVRITPPLPFQFPDWIECPKGSGSYYEVVDVLDYNKGMPNEERRVTMFWIYQGTFPIP
jgi:hypothetical protein